MLIDELKAIQKRHGFLPQGELRALASRARVPLYEVHGVASFYPHFHLEPPPAVRLGVCADLPCHLRRASPLEKAARTAAKHPHRVEVCEVPCLGRCDRPLAVSLNARIYDGLSPDEVASLAREAGGGGRVTDPRLTDPKPPRRRRRPSRPRWRSDPYDGEARYGALRALLASRDFDGAIKKLKESGLRGMGGAGFPAGVKWEIVRRAPGERKYVVCNADESEPGTFKDRVLLETAPHLILEGMALGGLCVGAERGILFLRHEYDHVATGFGREVRRARREGLLGRDLLGTGLSFEVEVFDSPGGYICGEETALLEALEGKRAEPRNRPPFPGTHGLFGKPTLIHNVETFAMVPAILLRGPEWYRAQGEGEGVGLKFLALSGDVKRPGVYEAPMGIPAGRFIEEFGGGVAGGKRLKAFSPGGTSSGFLPASMADVPLDFEPLARVGSMLGTGAVVALAEGRSMLEVALNAVRFFRNESCGKCVPCRMGTEKIVGILQEARSGRGRPEDLVLIDELSEAMLETSICGLGQAAPNPVLSALRHFREEIFPHFAGAVS